MEQPGFRKLPPRSLQLHDGGAARWLEHSISLSSGSCGLGSRAGLSDLGSGTHWPGEHGCVWKMASYGVHELPRDTDMLCSLRGSLS